MPAITPNREGLRHNARHKDETSVSAQTEPRPFCKSTPRRASLARPKVMLMFNRSVDRGRQVIAKSGLILMRLRDLPASPLNYI